MAEETKVYSVRYDIGVNLGNALKQLENFAKLPKALNESMTPVKESLNAINQTLNSVRGLSNASITIAIDTKKFQENLEFLKAEAQRTATQIAGMMQKAFTGVRPGKVGAEDLKKHPGLLGGVKSQIDSRIKMINALINKEQEALKTANESERAGINARIKSYNKDLVESTKLQQTYAQAISETSKKTKKPVTRTTKEIAQSTIDAKKVSQMATALNRLNTAVSKWNNRKSIIVNVSGNGLVALETLGKLMSNLEKYKVAPNNIKVGLDVSAAEAQLAALLAKIRESVAQIPVGVTGTGSSGTTSNQIVAAGKGTESRQGASKPSLAGYDSHMRYLGEREANKIVTRVNDASRMRIAMHAEKEQLYNRLFGREEMHRRWVEKDKAGESTRAKNLRIQQARAPIQAMYNELFGLDSPHAKLMGENKMGYTPASANLLRIKSSPNPVGEMIKMQEKYDRQLRQAALTKVFNSQESIMQSHNADKIREERLAASHLNKKERRQAERQVWKEAVKRAKSLHNITSYDAMRGTNLPVVSQTSTSQPFVYRPPKQGVPSTASKFIGNTLRLQEEAYYAQRQALYDRMFGGNFARTRDGLFIPQERRKNLVPPVNARMTQRLHDLRQAKYERMFGGGAARVTEDGMFVPQVMRESFTQKPEGAEETKSRRSGARHTIVNAQRPQNFATRLRKATYALTGNTSFGAQTPMMVNMAKGMGTMFAVGGAMSAVGKSFGQAMEYQNVMKTTEAILRNSDENFSMPAFKHMEGIVRNVGVKTKFSAPEVANAARFMAMAGYRIPEINAAIRPVADVALIGDTDLGETADKLTNVMTTFGIGPDQMRGMADIMTSTFTRSNTDMMMLAESAKYAGGIVNLYGRMNKNNFADFMAMVGILGNAGIQASSAGTTIRMMYNNLMQPNKKQKAALKKYGITTRNADDTALEMVDIVAQLAKIDPKILPDAVGQIFRITAQPGAATLASHMTDLESLMKANRMAVGSGISQSIAGEKQNTLSGLWAQVTSTFTEGVVKAFEGKEGGWAGKLAELRDYLAKPKTVEIIQSIIDLVETLGSTIARFADIWAKVYNAIPGVIKTWMFTQMMFTQLGYLITPIVSLVSAFSTLKNALVGLSMAATGASARVALSNGTVGALTAAEIAANRHSARGMIGFATGSRFASRAGTWKAMKYAAMKGATATVALGGFGGIASMFRGLMVSLASAVGLLVNPITLTIGSIAALGGIAYAVHKQAEKIRKEAEDHASKTLKATQDAQQKRMEGLNKLKPNINVNVVIPEKALNPTGSNNKDDKKNDDKKNNQGVGQVGRYSAAFTDNDNVSTRHYQNEAWTNFVNSDMSNVLALGNRYKYLTGYGLEKQGITSPFQRARGAVMIAGSEDPRIVAARKQIIQLRDMVGADPKRGGITEEEFRKKANEIYNNVMPKKKLISAVNINQIKAQNNYWDDFSEYWEGAGNVLQAEINAQKGSISAMREAEEKLKTNLIPYSVQWRDAMVKMLTGMAVPMTVGAENIVAVLNTLPDGTIDFAGIKNQVVAQLKKQQKNFKLTIETYSDFLKSIYEELAKIGAFGKDLYYKDAIKWFQDNSQSAELSEEEVSRYYDQNRIGEKVKEGNWAYGMSKKQYVDAVINGGDGENGELRRERRRIKKQVSGNAAIQAVRKMKKQTEKLQKDIGQDASGKNNDVAYKTDDDAKDQSKYKNKYRNEAAPKQVIINIQNLANFDRTAISKNADDQAIITSIENKITEAVAMLSAQTLTEAGAVMSQGL